MRKRNIRTVGTEVCDSILLNALMVRSYVYIRMDIMRTLMAIKDNLRWCTYSWLGLGLGLGYGVRMRTYS